MRIVKPGYSAEKKTFIRFGIMCNGLSFTKWEARCLDKILKLDFVELALLIINDGFSISRERKRRLEKLKDFKNLFWNIYNLINSLIFPIRTYDFSEKFANIVTIRCKIIKNSICQNLKETDISVIKEHNLDFILKFGSNILGGNILKAVPFGIWSFHHGNEKKYRGEPPCFWEIYKGDKLTGAALLRLTESPSGGVVLKKGFFKTIDTSWILNRNRVYEEISDWPAQVCFDIKNGNAQYINSSPSRTNAHLYFTPTNIQFIRYLVKIIKNFALKYFKTLLFFDNWNIGIIDQPISSFLEEGPRPKVRWLDAPARHKFKADPFGFFIGSTAYIAFEDFNYKRSKGCISITGINNKHLAESEVVIENSTHMSYPFLFKYDNQFFCIPETCESNEVGLYKIESFPNKWIKVAVLIDNFAGVDNTIFRHEGLWWIAATDNNDCADHKLKLWYSRELLGPWKPHLKNPVKIDIRSARPAGTPFIYKKKLYRPSQDCSIDYGRNIVINHVTALSPNEFKEDQVAVIEPFEAEPYPDGIHTISSCGSFTLIDAKKKELALKNYRIFIHNFNFIKKKVFNQLFAPK